MRLRERYQQELAALHTELRALGEMVVTAITRAVDALVRHDGALAQQVIAADAAIDKAQAALEEQVLVVMATQQPIAGDLRRLVAAIEIASELERIGDYAKGIAKIVGREAAPAKLMPTEQLPQMAQHAIAMLNEVLEAYVGEDAAVGQRLAEADDQVDALRRNSQADLIEAMQRDPAVVPQAVSQLFIVHNIERIADRATNIAERIVFMVSGENIELNP
jgi:phosphate transport system protein